MTANTKNPAPKIVRKILWGSINFLVFGSSSCKNNSCKKKAPMNKSKIDDGLNATKWVIKIDTTVKTKIKTNAGRFFIFGIDRIDCPLIDVPNAIIAERYKSSKLSFGYDINVKPSRHTNK